MSNDKKPDEPFLARWSRRKRGDAAELPANQPVTAVESTPPDATTKPQFDPATLPKIEDLLPDSDITAFLQKGVPDELKRLALRKAWSLDPSIRDFIEMAENQYDWNVPDGVPGFGALAEGTDIEALLAQATGKLPKLAEAETEPSAENEGSQPLTSPPSEGEIAASSPNDLAAPLPELTAVRHSGAELPDPQAEAVLAAPSPGTGHQNRHRHGGALPRNV